MPLALARLRLAPGSPDEALALLDGGRRGRDAVGTIERAVLTRGRASDARQREQSRGGDRARARARRGREHPPALARRRPVAAGAALGPPAALDRRTAGSRRICSPRSNGNERRWAAPAELLEPLTAREAEVLRYLPTMMSNADIAAELFVSVNTMKSHVKSIYRKLGATQRRDAVRRARQLHLL